jgi:hypothetical protein
MPLAEIDFVSPPDLVAIATSFFGGQIDLDPASSEEANKLINAYKFFTQVDNGLNQIWRAQSVYLYPPRDFLLSNEQPPDHVLFKRKRRFQKSAQRVWLEEILRKYRRAEFEEAVIFLTSSEVALLVTQKLNIDLPMCIMKKHPQLRLDEPGLPKLANTRCLGFVLYLPSPINTEQRVMEFTTQFSTLGRVYI